MITSYICSKASRNILCALSRVSSCLTVEGKLQVMNSYITSHFKFCSLIWYFCSASGMHKMGKVQQRTLIYIYNDLKRATPDLRARSHIQLLYTVTNGHFRKSFWDLPLDMPCLCEWTAWKGAKHVSTRNKYNIQIKCRTIKYGISSFTHEGANLWNVLRQDWPLLTADNADVLLFLCVLFQMWWFIFIIYAPLKPHLYWPLSSFHQHFPLLFCMFHVSQ